MSTYFEDVRLSVCLSSRTNETFLKKGYFTREVRRAALYLYLHYMIYIFRSIIQPSLWDSNGIIFGITIK